MLTNDTDASAGDERAAPSTDERQPRPTPVVEHAAAPGRADALDPQQVWATLRQHYRLVLLLATLVFAGVMGVTLLSRMSFRSVSRLYLGELEESSKSAARSSEEIDLSAGHPGVVGSEMEIIQSRSLVSRAILASGLNVAIAEVGRGAPRYGKWLIARRNPALLDVESEQLRAQETRLTDERAQEQIYQLRFSSRSEYEVWRDDRRLGAGKLGEVLKVPGADLQLVAGEAGSPRPGATYGIVVRPLMDVIDAALASLRVAAPKPSPQSPPVNVLTLEFSWSSPRLAASFLEQLIAAYLAERQAWKVEDAAAAEAFVGNQLATMRSSLDDIQRKLADYRSSNRVVVMDNEAKAMIEQIGKYEEQRVAARLEVAALSDVKRTLKGPNPPVGAFLMGEANDSVLEGMATSLSTARQRLTDLESRFNEAAPELRDQREQVQGQLQSIQNYVSSRASRAQESLGTLDGIIAQYEKRLKTVPGAELGLAQLSRESDVYSRTYSYLLERQQQTAIIKASTLSKNRVLDAPQAPYREDSPKLLLRLASAPLGLLLGVVLVLGRAFFASTFQSEADARSVAGRLSVLTVIPRRLRRRGERRGVVGPGSYDVVGADLGSSFTEAFRTLRARLYRVRSGSAGQVLLVTSPREGDGKTTCVLGLAALLAADGKRVLVIDADLRGQNQPSPDSGQPDMPGLREVLRGEHDWADAVQTVKVGAGQFYGIASGGVGPAELLSSRRMAELVNDARQRCDFVLLDAPSFPAVSDALVLAALVDAVISVVRLGNTPRKLAHEHLRGLAASARYLGVVVNDVGQSKPSVRPAKERGHGKAKAAVVTKATFRPARWRGLAWWIGALLLMGAAAAFYSHNMAEATAPAATSRHAG